MKELKSLINKKLKKLGLKKKIDEKVIIQTTEKFLKENLKKIIPKEISYFNGVLMIKVANAIQANELRFFEEEIIFLLKQKGYQIRKIRIFS